jgi:hypothetical protein
MTKSKKIIFLIKNNSEDLKNSWNCPKNIEDLIPSDAYLESNILVLEMALGFYLVSKILKNSNFTIQNFNLGGNALMVSEVNFKSYQIKP